MEPLTLGAPLEVGVEPYVKGSAAGGLSAGSRLAPRAQPVFVGVHSPGLGQHQKAGALFMLSPAPGHHPAQEAAGGKATELQLQQLTQQLSEQCCMGKCFSNPVPR